MLQERKKTHLHSILVKSIHGWMGWVSDGALIYIPFWLNLYADDRLAMIKSIVNLHSILVKSIPLYSDSFALSQAYLQSILVKSIRRHIEGNRGRGCIYIPFWLNLYWQGGTPKQEYDSFTFHSG